MSIFISFPAILELGSEFYDEVAPAKFPSAILRYHNQSASKILGLETWTPEEWKRHFWAFEAIPGNLTLPLALRYHGHQFTSYNPDLGDGRGFLFAQYRAEGKLYDLGTKGSGQTPYSRQGDGRLTLKGAVREILATELLESYGVNTSRTFSVFETGENLQRNDEPSPTRSAVLVRMNHSHIRFGTFQRLAFLNQPENIKKLLKYCLRHFYPEILNQTEADQAPAFFRAVCDRSAQLAAQWMMSGFVHGVMNTDNMNITGESFDYGPYRFLPTYDPHFTAAYFDHQGLYSYGRQPVMMLWNVEQLSLALNAAYPEIDFKPSLEEFSEFFHRHSEEFFLRRLNLKKRSSQADPAGLLSRLFYFLQETEALFEQTFFDLHSGISEERLQRSPQGELYKSPAFESLRKGLADFEVRDERKKSHPYFESPQACSLLIEELESLWQPIAASDDWRLFEKKLESIRAFRGVYSA